MVAFARWRLASLWWSQVARVLADNALRVFVVLELAQAGARQQGAAWHLGMAVFIAPAVVFSPFIGALSNSVPRRWVLVVAATFTSLVLAAQAFMAFPWLAVWALVAMGAAIYSPTRYAVLPAAAVETHLPLTRVTGWVEMGAALAIVGGLMAGFALQDKRAVGPLPLTAVFALGLNVLAVPLAWPAHFAADLRRQEGPAKAILGYFRDFGRLIKSRETRVCLLAMALFRGLVTSSAGAAVALTLGQIEAGSSGDLMREFLRIGLWVGIGAAVGSLVASLQGHSYRALSFVALGVTGLALALGWAALTEATANGLCFAIGMMAVFINVPLAAAFQLHVPADAHGNAMAVRTLCEYLGMTVLSVALALLAGLDGIGPAGQFWVVAILACSAALLAWVVLARVVVEQLWEWMMVPMYRIHGHGPGLETVPLGGPLLIVANHSAYLDPLWLGKVVPRQLTPMMTSAFYDIPGSYFFWKHVMGVIRVERAGYRREAPELREAIAALDRGCCVVVFPEGSLRRDEERPLRRFGQGVWHILRERPGTPVIVCWIEGGWGSFFSYQGGPPMKNKSLDCCRPIDVVVSQATPLDAVVLEEHLTTRSFLHAKCLEQRRLLGLADIASNESEKSGPHAEPSSP